MAKRPLPPSVVPATLVVAAANSLHPERADYRCTGINDHLVIQAALDALPAMGGEVKLLEGTYHCEVTINLDSNQTLRGCGRNTILITSACISILKAMGTNGNEKVGIVITDMQLDGNNVGDIGIHFEYVDYSLIQNVYSRRHYGGSIMAGIILSLADFNIVVNCLCTESLAGIEISTGVKNIISNNICKGNDEGIWLYDADYNTIIANVCQGNRYDGVIAESSDHNSILTNICLENSQQTNNSRDDIRLAVSNYNNIQGNTCRAGALVKKPKYGINISGATCNGNLVTNNDLYNDGFGTGSFNNAGTGTVTAAGNRV